MSPPAFQLFAGDANEAPPTNPSSNPNGLPIELVDGFLATTGHDLSNVLVHKNSDQPQKMGALAYAQGNDIYLGTGQEEHLGHEAAHIVQQREGRVTATTEIAGLPVNDSPELEHEADALARQAEESGRVDQPKTVAATASEQKTLQMQVSPLQFDGLSIHYEVIPEETYERGSLEVGMFAALMQGALLPNLPAHFARAPHILALWPAVANILYAGNDGSNTHAITDATSAFNPSSYTSLEENERAVIQAFYNARWNCHTAAERRRLIGQGRAAAAGNLASNLVRYYFQEASRGEITEYFSRLIDHRLREIQAERFFTLNADGQLQAYVPPPRPPRAPAMPTDPREIEMGTLADGIAESRLGASPTVSPTVEPSTPEVATTDTTGETTSAPAEAAETTRLPGYRRINAANMAAESGGSYTPSRIGTSAGRPASLGRSQLLVELQVDRCKNYLQGRDGSGHRIAAGEAANYQRAVQILTEAQLTSAKLADIDRRGKLMASLYTVVTNAASEDRQGEARLRSATRMVSEAGMDASGIRAAGLARDATTLGSAPAHGRTVEQALDTDGPGAADTAISSSDLVAMSDYNAIRRGHNEFRALLEEYAHLHPRTTTREGTMTVVAADTNPRFADVRALLSQEQSFTIANVSNSRNEAAVRSFYRNLPSISPLVTRLMNAHTGESNQMGESDIDRHMSRGLRGEDRNGWYTRGAMNSPFWREFEAVMPALDRFTTEERHLDNFQQALAAASTFTGWAALSRAAQEVMLGQMARVNHGSTSNFQEWYGGDDRTVTTVEGYRSHVAGLFHPNGEVDHDRSRGILAWTRHYCVQQHLDPTDTSIEIFLPVATRAILARLLGIGASGSAGH